MVCQHRWPDGQWDWEEYDSRYQHRRARRRLHRPHMGTPGNHTGTRLVRTTSHRNSRNRRSWTRKITQAEIVSQVGVADFQRRE